jgi:hypothetical protein
LVVEPGRNRRKVPYHMVSHTTLHTTLRIIRGDKIIRQRAWEKQIPSARGSKRVGRHSECAIETVWLCPGGSRKMFRGFK